MNSVPDSIFKKYDLIDVDESIPIPVMPSTGLIFICGTSGSGKSTILKHIFGTTSISFSDKPLYQNFSSEQEAERLLIACGLRTIPAWRRPYSALSNGEKHRAYCAKSLDSGIEYLDEFTSVVDRDTARSLAYAIQKHFRNSGMKRLIIASCHRDILEWLNPDHVYNTDSKMWESTGLPRGCLHRPKINLRIEAVDGKEVWEIFKKHHYLSGKFNPAANSFSAFIGIMQVGFCSILRFPNGNISNGWREHRTVVLPEFQGMGIGTVLCETVAQLVVDSGGRFFSKTSHPAFGLHRECSKKWRATSKNKKDRCDYNTDQHTKEDGHKMKHRERVCYSHEFMGESIK
jgi:energy-coupling factor transporter ATP-binding protein EcfA2